MILNRAALKIRTRCADALNDYDVQVVRPEKLLVVLRDNSDTDSPLVRGTVLVRGLYPTAQFKEGYDAFEDGAYSADEGLAVSAVSMLLSRGELEDLISFVNTQAQELMRGSHLNDRSWHFRTSPLIGVLNRLRTERGHFRNQHLLQLEGLLRGIALRKDSLGRRNPAASAAKLRSPRIKRLAKCRIGELDGTRRAALDRSQDVWLLINRHLRTFSDLEELIGAALFGSKPRPGALKQPSPWQLCKLGDSLNKLIPDLDAIVAKPFDRVAALCVRDATELAKLIHTTHGKWTLQDVAHVSGRRLGLKLYTAARAVRVHDEIRREHKMVALNLPYKEAPEVTIRAVQAACDTVHSWIQRVPEDANCSLDHPFKEVTREAVADARDCAALLLTGALAADKGLKRLKGALGRAGHALMYGEVPVP